MKNRIVLPYGLIKGLVQALLLSGALGACTIMGDNGVTGQPATEPPPASQVLLPSASESPPDTPEQILTNDMMYDILLGEIAGQRGDIKVSVTRYLQAADQARDPRVAERAMQIASFAKEYELALRAARRWVVLDSDNLEARKALTALALQQGDLEEVVAQMDYLLRSSSDPEETFRMVTVVLARHGDKQAAVDAAQRMVDRYPANAHAWMALSRLAVVAEQPERALAAVNRAIELQPELKAAIILKAQVLVRQQQNDAATALLREATAKYPDDTELLFTYGRMLLDVEDLEGAKRQILRVVKLDPEHADALYSLALLELETKKYRSGEKYLKRLIDLNQHVQNAYYYLGYAALEQGRDAKALDWYLQVESGDYWNQAQLRIASIMVRQGDIGRMQAHMRELRQKNPQMTVQLYVIEGQVLTEAELHQQAFDLYGRALEYSPGELDLLYSQALAAEKLNKLTIAERNMRNILAIDPDNVRTLNALGYTLADRTDRYQEALQYIRKAYASEPDDPAIIDSMGWVHFRLGDLDKAHTYLQQAWEVSQDSEIGAHLGEVLWVRGERAAAKTIWEASRQATPDNPVLLEVINRLNP